MSSTRPVSTLTASALIVQAMPSCARPVCAQAMISAKTARQQRPHRSHPGAAVVTNAGKIAVARYRDSFNHLCCAGFRLTPNDAPISQPARVSSLNRPFFRRERCSAPRLARPDRRSVASGHFRPRHTLQQTAGLSSAAEKTGRLRWIVIGAEKAPGARRDRVPFERGAYRRHARSAPLPP